MSDNEASMESILGVIQKIIKEDNEQRKEHTKTLSEDLLKNNKEDEPLLLTELMESSVDSQNPSSLSTEPLELGESVVEENEKKPLDLKEELVGMSSESIITEQEDSIVSPTVSEAGALAFRELEQSVRIGYAGETLEEVIKGLLAPMLQKWLDQNLAQIVQDAVDREIQRMVGSARKK